MNDWRKEEKKCWKCGRIFPCMEYSPKYDMYGMMGNGYVEHCYCWECKPENWEHYPNKPVGLPQTDLEGNLL